MQEAGFQIRVVPSAIKEKVRRGEHPQNLVCRLAYEKAQQVAQKFSKDIVLGADTIVFQNGEILGKPATLEIAKETLLRLRGCSHKVYTGVCLFLKSEQKYITWHSVTKVKFKEFSLGELEFCLKTGNPLDKAGGYAFQEHEHILVSSYTGLQSTIIGLPIEEVVSNLKTFLNS